MMLVRRYEEKDRDAFIKLMQTVFPNPKPHNEPRRRLEAKLRMGDGLILVAEEGGQLIGGVNGGYDGIRGWVYALAVLPEHRRKGVGSNLLRALKEELRRRGCLKVNLQVRETNREVVGFYRANGFEVDPVISMGERLY